MPEINPPSLSRTEERKTFAQKVAWLFAPKQERLDPIDEALRQTRVNDFARAVQKARDEHYGRLIKQRLEEMKERTR